MRALTMEFKALEREPVEGFLVTIPDETDFYTWQVAIFGPPETPYEGGYFKVGLFFDIIFSWFIYLHMLFFHPGRSKVPVRLSILSTTTAIPHTNLTPERISGKELFIYNYRTSSKVRF